MDKLKAAEIKTLAKSTEDAYAFPTYGEREWIRAIRLLSDRGYNGRGIEAILRSKIARWAADSRPAAAKPRGDDIINYLDDPKNKVTHATITRLAQETFNDDGQDLGNPTSPRPKNGADLAGFAEGEDIADLIDLARTLRSIGGPAAVNLRASEILARIEARAK